MYGLTYFSIELCGVNYDLMAQCCQQTSIVVAYISCTSVIRGEGNGYVRDPHLSLRHPLSFDVIVWKGKPKMDFGVDHTQMSRNFHDKFGAVVQVHLLNA
jgi:hypothetical protein